MGDIIQGARLDDLSSTVTALTWPDHESYMYLECVPNVWLDDVDPQAGVRIERLDLSVDWNAWERGRLFCDTFELRWEKQDVMFQAVYIGPPVDLPDFTLSTEVSLDDTLIRERIYYLWGNRVPEDQFQSMGVQARKDTGLFLEFKVPRLFYYPVSDHAQQVKARVCEYIDPGSGAVVYQRFVGLEEVL